MTAMPPTPAPHAPTGDCIRCGFERRETPWTTCPECGADVQTRERLSRRTAHGNTAVRIALGIAVSVLLLRTVTIHLWMATSGSAPMPTARALEWDAAMKAAGATNALLLLAALAAGLLVLRALAGTEHRSLHARITAGAALAIALVGAGVFVERLLDSAAVEQQSDVPASVRALGTVLRASMQMAPVLAGALLALAQVPEFPTLAQARRRARVGATLAVIATIVGLMTLVAPLPSGVASWALLPSALILVQVAAALAALAACRPLAIWLQAQLTPEVRRAPGEPLPPGATLTLADAMDRGGIPLGLVVGLLGVMPWVIWSSPNDDALLGAGPPAWMTARWIVTAGAALAWVIPAYLLPNPRAARWWKWSAAATILAAAALAGR